MEDKKTGPTASTLTTQSAKEDRLPQTAQPVCSMPHASPFCSPSPFAFSSKKMTTITLISFGKNTLGSSARRHCEHAIWP